MPFWCWRPRASGFVSPKRGDGAAGGDERAWQDGEHSQPSMRSVLAYHNSPLMASRTRSIRPPRSSRGNPNVDQSTLVRSRQDRAKGIQDLAAALRHGIVAKLQSKQLVACVGNEGYAASLERRMPDDRRRPQHLSKRRAGRWPWLLPWAIRRPSHRTYHAPLRRKT
jgi:hypothetical protein